MRNEVWLFGHGLDQVMIGAFRVLASVLVQQRPPHRLAQLPGRLVFCLVDRRPEP
jgi:hypothetical protein